MSPSHRSKQSLVSEFQSEDFSVEKTQVETEILSFCEQELEKTNSYINKAYKEGKEIRNIDKTQRALKKLMPAKLALSIIIRAIKKRDYMIL